MEVINSQQAASLIRSSKGKLFTVHFTKRTTGERRKLTGRLGVRKGVTGVGMSYDPAAHGLITVHEFVGEDRNERGQFVNTFGQFRTVPIDGIHFLKIGGQEYSVR